MKETRRTKQVFHERMSLARVMKMQEIEEERFQ